MKRVAYSAARRCRRPEFADDFVSYGTVGLIDAAGKYQNCRGAQFNTYAEFRIRGAILDGMREMDMLPRKLRRESKRRGENPFVTDEGLLNKLPDPRAADPIDRIQQKEVARIVRRSLGKLPDKERKAVILHYFHNLNHWQIAEVLRINKFRVPQLLKRACLCLRSYSELWRLA